ncbi:MAG TPA: hypothetical protein VFP40_11490, partial [Terriglobales bacterium]|nr:hypothetical protein [Terriglobales bacterium]
RARNLANLGFAYFEMKKYFEAQQALLGALEFEQPANWHGLIHLYLGLTYAKLRKLREAEKELLICADRAHEWNLSLSNTYGWLAKVYKRLGDSARSKEYERLALTV